MKQQHTPGPWRDGLHYQGRLAVQAENGRLVALGGLLGQDDMQIENAANTRLIAAAPELLEALKLMRDAFLDTEGSHGTLEQTATDAADNAIAKATGGEV